MPMIFTVPEARGGFMSTVSIVKCADYEESSISAALNKTFENLGGVDKYIKQGMKVALKANLVMRKHPEDAATTHPALVKALVHIIQRAGATATILDSPGGPYNESLLKGVYSVCGMEKVSADTGAHLNFDLSEVKVDNPDGLYLRKVTVIKPLIDADLIINLPKLKTHGQMVYTGAVKNMFGAIAGTAKAEYHFRLARHDEFANGLIDIFLSVKPGLSIMDAVIGMEGNGPSAGNPRKIGLLLAGENAFELDMTALNAVGVNPTVVPVMKHAMDRGICPRDFKDIELTGEDINNVRISDFNLPQIKYLKNIQFFDNRLLRTMANVINPRPVFVHGKCVGCADCARSCPAKVITMKNKKPEVDLSRCIRCFCCQELCPAKAIVIKRPSIARFILAAGSSIALSSRKKKKDS